MKHTKSLFTEVQQHIKMNILIVEDEPKTAKYLAKSLIENQFHVDIAYNGNDGLHMAMETDYHLIILDITLPGIDGWKIIRILRNSNNKTPIIVLTAQDAVTDRVKGLELGADDYLVKPFAFSELLARIRVILRRGQLKEIHYIEISDLKINMIAHKVFRNNKPIMLSSKEFSLLTLLAQRQGELLTRSYIIEKVWGFNFDTDSNLVDVAIRRLRIKIDEDHTQKLIHTIRGIGYVLEEKISA